MVARVSLWLRKKIVAAAMGVCDEPPGPRLTPPPPFLTDLLVCRLLYIFIYLFVFVSPSPCSSHRGGVDAPCRCDDGLRVPPLRGEE